MSATPEKSERRQDSGSEAHPTPNEANQLRESQLESANPTQHNPRVMDLLKPPVSPIASLKAYTADSMPEDCPLEPDLFTTNDSHLWTDALFATSPKRRRVADNHQNSSLFEGIEGGIIESCLPVERLPVCRSLFADVAGSDGGAAHDNTHAFLDDMERQMWEKFTERWCIAQDDDDDIFSTTMLTDNL